MLEWRRVIFIQVRLSQVWIRLLTQSRPPKAKVAVDTEADFYATTRNPAALMILTIKVDPRCEL